MVEKNWTVEQVLAEQEKAQSEGLECFDPTGPVYKWNALRILAQVERQFANGDRFALLHAIKLCAAHGLVIPKWAARGYIRCFDTVLNYHTDSWDGAFGRPYPNGMHLSKARQRRQLRFAVHGRILEIMAANPKRPVDEGLFASVGDEFDIGKTLCSQLYYEAKRLTGLPRNS